MKKILITSSGFLREPIRDEIVKILPEERPLKAAYIPSASEVVKDDSYAKRDVEIMKDLGIEVDEIHLDDITEEELEARLREGDFIYVQGGNPYWLLKQARESGFDRIVPQLINEGVPYIGKSAGAYILAPEVVIPDWLEGKWRRFDVKDVKGMGVVPFIWAAHYTDDYKELIEGRMDESDYPVRAITNDQAILVTDEGSDLIGIGEEHVFNHRREDKELFRDPEIK